MATSDVAVGRQLADEFVAKRGIKSTHVHKVSVASLSVDRNYDLCRRDES
jgi:hypothetical protein